MMSDKTHRLLQEAHSIRDQRASVPLKQLLALPPARRRSPRAVTRGHQACAQSNQSAPCRTYDRGRSAADASFTFQNPQFALCLHPVLVGSALIAGAEGWRRGFFRQVEVLPRDRQNSDPPGANPHRLPGTA